MKEFHSSMAIAAMWCCLTTLATEAEVPGHGTYRLRLATAWLLFAALLAVGCDGEDAKPAPQEAKNPIITEETKRRPVERRTVGLRPYQASAYSGRVPGWQLVRNETQRQEVTESKWQGPAGASVLIDTVPEETQPADKATQIRDVVQQGASYRELSFGSVQLADRNAWRWVFESEGKRRVDYFLQECGTGFAVLGVAPPGGFPAYARLFRWVAESVRPTCSEGPSTSPDQSADRATAEPDSGVFEGDRGTCGNLSTERGRYSVQLQGFTQSPGPGCREAKRIVNAYLTDIAPKPGSVEGWRCTFSQRGTVAATTFGRVACRRDEPGQIGGVLLGT